MGDEPPSGFGSLLRRLRVTAAGGSENAGVSRCAKAPRPWRPARRRQAAEEAIKTGWLYGLVTTGV